MMNLISVEAVEFYLQLNGSLNAKGLRNENNHYTHTHIFAAHLHQFLFSVSRHFLSSV